MYAADVVLSTPLVGTGLRTCITGMHVQHSDTSSAMFQFLSVSAPPCVAVSSLCGHCCAVLCRLL